MCICPRPLLLSALAVWLSACPFLRAETGDVDNSHDYPGFTRLPGYVITDYTEDNPAGYDFPVARPVPEDAARLEIVPAKGHRYVIRYEVSGAAPSTLYQTQLWFEKLSSGLGYTTEKDGATGDVTESFHLQKGGRDIWVYLEPAVTSYVLTIVEGKGEPPPAVAAAPPVTPPPPVPPPQAAAPPPVLLKTGAPSEAPVPVPETAAAPEDAFYTALVQDGRVILPLTFTPGKPQLDEGSQPVIDRVTTMMKRHPDLTLVVEGHTDNTGDPEYNMMLSKQRASAVRTLVIAGEISRKRLTAVGLGGTKPLAEETSRETREKNRRIELVVKKETPPGDDTPKKPVKKKGTAKPVKKDADATADDSFHAPAPDGVNYYPTPRPTASTSTSPSSGKSPR